MKRTATTTVCCVCGAHINGPWPPQNPDLSHGYCNRHFKEAMQEIHEYLRRARLESQLVDAA